MAMPTGPLNRTILIAGPTASGKSAAALATAIEIGGEIINADAIQVYRDLRILSARPGAEDEARAPHHLFGLVDGQTRYSAGGWARDAAKAIAGVHARGNVAIVVGGTGLYFRALEHGLSAAPEISPGIRSAAEARYKELGAEGFRDEVLRVDPAMARLKPADRQRHIRAWEVFHAVGEPLSQIQVQAGSPTIDRIDARIVIEPPRDRLYRQIDARFDDMLARGGLDEARRLAERALDPRLPVMKAVGVAELLEVLAGQLTIERAADLARRNSRRLAKRQMTWFRNQAGGWPRAETIDEAIAALIGAGVASFERRG
jgi:tRNA dimethylallyltransferase